MAPESPHSAGFLESEWNRFTRGWEALGSDKLSEAEAKAFARQGTGTGAGDINLPGWSDVIHATPRYQPTREEASEYFGARRERRPANLSPDAIAAIESRENLKDRMANSAQPGYAQAFGQMMTAIDNVQDAIATAATLGRLTVNPALRALGHFAPELAAKLGARLIPGIGWVLAAADLLNLLRWLGMGGLIGYGALCAGLRGAAAPAIVAAAQTGLPALRPCGGKAKVGQVADLNPFAAAGRLKNLKKAARAMPSFGNLLEAAQTTDQLFGVGVSLGGLFGAVMESAYSAVGAGRGAGTRVNPSAVDPRSSYRGPAGGTLPYSMGVELLRRHAPATLARVQASDTLPLVIKAKLARVLLDAPALLADPGTLSERDYSAALIAECFALDTVARDLDGADTDNLLLELAGLEVSPVVVVPLYLGELLGQTPDQGATVGRWALPGAPRAVRGADYVEGFAPGVSSAVATWLAPRRNDVAGMFLGGCIVQGNARAWQLVTGESDPFRWSWTPDYVVLSSLMDASLYPSENVEDEALWSWWTELRQVVAVDDRGSLLPQELLESAHRYGVPLIYAEQPYLRGELPSTQGV